MTTEKQPGSTGRLEGEQNKSETRRKKRKKIIRRLLALLGVVGFTALATRYVDNRLMLPNDMVAGTDAFAHDLVDDPNSLHNPVVEEKRIFLKDVRTENPIRDGDGRWYPETIDVVVAQDDQGGDVEVLSGDQIFPGQNVDITRADFLDDPDGSIDSDHPRPNGPRLLLVAGTVTRPENSKVSNTSKDYVGDDVAEAVRNPYPDILTGADDRDDNVWILVIFSPKKENADGKYGPDESKTTFLKVPSDSELLVKHLPDGKKQILTAQPVLGSFSATNLLVENWIVDQEGKLEKDGEIDTRNTGVLDLLTSSGEPQNIDLYKKLAGPDYQLVSHTARPVVTQENMLAGTDRVVLILIEDIVLKKTNGDMVDGRISSILQLSWKEENDGIHSGALPIIRSLDMRSPEAPPVENMEAIGDLEAIGFLNNGNLVIGERVFQNDKRSSYPTYYYGSILLHRGDQKVGYPPTHQIPLPPTTQKIMISGNDVTVVTPTGEKWILNSSYYDDDLNWGDQTRILDPEYWQYYWSHIDEKISMGNQGGGRQSSAEEKKAQRRLTQDLRNRTRAFQRRQLI